MLYPVVKREALTKCGFVLDINQHYKEDTVDHVILDKLLMSEARWLPAGKGGKLLGFDPETEIRVGLRLALNENNQVLDSDIFNRSLVCRDGKDTLAMLTTNALEAAVEYSSGSHAYTINGMYARGWTVVGEPDSSDVYISRNFVADAQINRRVNLGN